MSYRSIRILIIIIFLFFGEHHKIHQKWWAEDPFFLENTTKSIGIDGLFFLENTTKSIERPFFFEKEYHELTFFWSAKILEQQIWPVTEKSWAPLEYFNRFACFWPKCYQLGSLGKSHQNGDYLKQAMRKIVFPQESNLQPLDYRPLDSPVGRQFFALLVLSSRRSGGSSLGFRAGSL